MGLCLSCPYCADERVGNRLAPDRITGNPIHRTIEMYRGCSRIGTLHVTMHGNARMCLRDGLTPQEIRDAERKYMQAGWVVKEAVQIVGRSLIVTGSVA